MLPKTDEMSMQTEFVDEKCKPVMEGRRCLPSTISRGKSKQSWQLVNPIYMSFQSTSQKQKYEKISS